MNFKKIGFHARKFLKNPEVFREIIRSTEKFCGEIFLTPGANNYLENKFPEIDFHKDYDFFVIFGGDGSVLKMISKMKNFRTPILGISAGSLGFLAEIEPKNFSKACQHICQKKFTEDFRTLLEVEIVEKDKEIKKIFSLNEIVISQGSVARLADLRVEVNGEFLTNFRADGLIVSTPTGSTAYSLSAGGPIVYPKFSAMILTPISPHSFSHRPIVLTSEKILQISASKKNRESLVATIDGQIAIELTEKTKVFVKIASEKIKFLRLLDESFFKTLRRKLKWGSK